MEQEKQQKKSTYHHAVVAACSFAARYTPGPHLRAALLTLSLNAQDKTAEMDQTPDSQFRLAQTALEIARLHAMIELSALGEGATNKEQRFRISKRQWLDTAADYFNQYLLLRKDIPGLSGLALARFLSADVIAESSTYADRQIVDARSRWMILQALHILGMAEEIAPNDPYIAYQIGLLKSLNGEPTEAVNHLLVAQRLLIPDDHTRDTVHQYLESPGLLNGIPKGVDFEILRLFAWTVYEMRNT